MLRAMISVLALASGSLQASQVVVRSIGLHQYVVTDAGKQEYSKANETCAKLGRKMMPLGVPPEEVGIASGKQFKFECILAYEIVPSGRGTYTIHVPTKMMMLARAERMGPTGEVLVTPPDIGPASEKSERTARGYCAKTHKTMVGTGGGFDMGPGFTLIFKCVPQ